MTSLKELKSANQQFKDIVFGYIRSMKGKVSNHTIPHVINYLILKFYLNDDWFKNGGTGLTISKDKKSITIHDDAYQYVYGKTWIEYGWKARWKFKITDIDKWYNGVIISVSFLLRNKSTKTLAMTAGELSGFGWKTEDEFQVDLDTEKGCVCVQKIGTFLKKKFGIYEFRNIEGRSNWDCKIALQTVKAAPNMVITMTYHN